MKKILKLTFCIFIFSSLFLVSCNKSKDDIINNPKGVNLTVEEATVMFHTMYGMNNLEDQHVVLLDNTLYIEFYFGSKASESEIDSARSFTLITLVLDKISPYGEIPYMTLVTQGENKYTWENTICNIYKENQLIYYEKYNGMTLEASEKY